MKSKNSNDFRDHPRVCGEHDVGAQPAGEEQGSSPRMRGTLQGGGGLRVAVGIIPAYAGNTRAYARQYATPQDHPRVCGEHPVIVYFVGGLPGSSPRMRGTPDVLDHLRADAGIIPAYAGNTCVREWTVRPFRDHPRVCGEHAGRARTAQLDDGIIPAYAGNTPHTNRIQRPSRDHPRVCGEHICLSRFTMARWGSSPRMRGTHHAQGQGDQLQGIIPAYAGNTSSSAATRTSTGDHPRVCGEHTITSANEETATGSSPRMRGTRAYRYAGQGADGIIPAYAGNTWNARGNLRSTWDHPRVCGEHTKRLA